jgi:cytochrome b561
MTDSYTRTAIGLHWIVAALVITALTMGWIMTDLPISPERVKVFDWHKWIGITILALFFVRTAWRLGHPAPPLLPMPAW